MYNEKKGEKKMKSIQLLQQYIKEAHYIVFLDGAGVSTESGIPDFRSQNGLYKIAYPYPPETILSHTFFERNPSIFFSFYKEKMNFIDKKPNIVHNYLAKLEKQGKLKAIITQNIDGLHAKAGCKNILELHGSIYQNHCLKCGKKYEKTAIFDSNLEIPTCKCGGVLKPDVVLYEEPLPDGIFENAISHVRKADLFIIAGTSLKVFPANTLLKYFNGSHLVILNKEKTGFDQNADLTIHDNFQNIFSNLS